MITRKKILYSFLSLLFAAICFFTYIFISIEKSDQLHDDLSTAISNNNSEDAFKLFTKLKNQYFIKLYTQDNFRKTLVLAIENEQYQLAHEMLQHSMLEYENDDSKDNSSKDMLLHYSLLAACKKNSTQILQDIIDQGKKLNFFKHYDIWSHLKPIMQTIDIDIIKTLISNKIYTNLDINSAFIEATKDNRFDIITQFLSIPEITKETVRSSLLLAANKGNLDIVTSILQQQSDITLFLTYHDTIKNALASAARNNHTEIIKELLQYHESITNFDKIYNMTLSEAIYYNNMRSVKELLTIKNYPITNLKKLLNFAIKSRDLEFIQEILQNFILPSPGQKVSNEQYYTLNEGLLVACKQCYSEIVDLLLFYKADPNHYSTSSQTSALLTAAEKGNSEIVTLLLDAKADPNIKNYDGNTPLIKATINNHADIVMLLLEAKANPNIKSKLISHGQLYGDIDDRESWDRENALYGPVQKDWTALHYASRNKNQEIIDMLLQAGANPSIKDYNNKPALQQK